MKKTLLLIAVALLACTACKKRGTTATYSQKMFIMNVQGEVRGYGPGQGEIKPLADEIFAEWNRITGEFSYSEPYSMTALVNSKAYGEWVPVSDEFLRLLQLGLDYYKLTDGAFDVTFAPLWPIWQEAASSRRMPEKADIKKALEGIGSSYVQVDRVKKQVRFSRPVQVNINGLLRAYCFERAYQILKKRAPNYPVQLRLGGNMLVYGDRAWQYRVQDPLDQGKLMGRFLFRRGVIMCSSGRESFVEIEGKRYSHILDLRTGYPIEDFSNLVVYYPDLESAEFLGSSALAVMGRDKALKSVGAIKGAAAVWMDGQGKPFFTVPPNGGAKWEEDNGTFSSML